MSEAAEKVWEPLSQNAQRRTDMLTLGGDTSPTYAVRWAFEASPTYSVDFAIYQTISNGKEPIYQIPDATGWGDSTTDIDHGRPLCHGFVKWDGCTQFWFDDSVHVDSHGDLTDLFAAIEHARKVALVEIIGEKRDKNAAPGPAPAPAPTPQPLRVTLRSKEEGGTLIEAHDDDLATDIRLRLAYMVGDGPPSQELIWHVISAVNSCVALWHEKQGRRSHPIVTEVLPALKPEW